MERTTVIDGLKVYVGGSWFEISLPHGGGVIFSGNCLPDTDPQRIYDYCFPLAHMGDGKIHEGVTLFFGGGSALFAVPAGYALLANEDFRKPWEGGYCLWYAPPSSITCNTVTFRWEPHVRPKRPRIICAEGRVALPPEIPAGAPQAQAMNAARPKDPALLDTVTSYLDRSGVPWAKM